MEQFTLGDTILYLWFFEFDDVLQLAYFLNVLVLPKLTDFIPHNDFFFIQEIRYLLVFFLTLCL